MERNKGEKRRRRGRWRGIKERRGGRWSRGEWIRIIVVASENIFREDPLRLIVCRDRHEKGRRMRRMERKVRG